MGVFWALLELSQAWVECCKDWLPIKIYHLIYICLHTIKEKTFINKPDQKVPYHYDPL